MKHKHAELIHAWAEGAEIEYRIIFAVSSNWSEWQPFESSQRWELSNSVEYRIKPDSIKKKPIYVFDTGNGFPTFSFISGSRGGNKQLGVIYMEETYE